VFPFGDETNAFADAIKVSRMRHDAMLSMR
jgi:hypothetical protein